MSADAIRDLIAQVLPGPQWALQYGEWRDPGGSTRAAVLRPVGGATAALLRRPAYRLTLVGLAGGDNNEIRAAADAVIERVRSNSGGLVFLEAGEPVYIPTADRRPTFEIALNAITT